MGFKRSLDKFLGGDTAGSKKGTEKEIDKTVHSAVSKNAHDTGIITTTKTRQVGSLWQHTHDDLDWHTMSIPHPASFNKLDTIEGKGEPENKEITISKKEIYGKFVIQGNKRIGETISLDSGLLVCKNKAEHLSVPVASIVDITNDEVKVGEFDREEALSRGEEWVRRTTDTLKFDEKGMLIND